MTRQRFFVTRAKYPERVTWDEFMTRAEAMRAAADYQQEDPTARYYMSTKPCKNWS